MEMEVKTSSPKLDTHSPSECNSDPEEKEISDDDDDDRNHKHRRRDIRSQSLERDTQDPVVTRPFRKRNKPFQNGNNFRDNDSQASANWKNFNSNTPGKDFTGKFDKRRPGIAIAARSPLDVNQRFRPNQIFAGDPGPVRGRGRDIGLWNQHESRFVPDLASQVVTGSIPPSLFAGRGLSNVSNGPTPPWTPFGLIPGIPNGGLDAIHSIGLQGPLRPPIPAALNMGIPLQRCRDFEERGFCLRGDMCPMEHGVNRIVIEDVQSLSQFNLPVSLPSAHLLGPTSGPGPGSLASINSSSVTAVNSKGIHSKASKPGFTEDVLGLNGSYPGSSAMAGADLYDPDQPLWNNNGPETSNTLLGLHSTKIDDTELLTNGDPSDNEFPGRNTGNNVGSSITSVWGRIGNSKGRLDAKEKNDAAINSSGYLENESKVDKARQGKRVVTEGAGLKPLLDSSVKTSFDATHNARKPSQKALRTLFVNGIPLKNNKRENLLAHFQKFGEVIDIYIPVNSERAFVQFSKKEEAEAALKAPDAVMGNRFIKLWWANRDSVPEDNTSSATSVGGAMTNVVSSVLVLPHSSLASGKKESLQAVATKSSVAPTPAASVPASESSKLVVANGPKVVPPSQKKLDLLKEELRKKQEMLEQKRIDFKRQLVKLEKQATGSKGDLDSEQVAKRPKIATDVVNSATTPRPSDAVVSLIKSSHTDKTEDKNKSGEIAGSHSPKANAMVAPQESMSSKQQPSVRPFTQSGHPFLMNRYKLDNRPTAFRILPPLPAGFANVATVKEHFLPYGEISNVELEVEASNGNTESESSKDSFVRISFLTRRAAERAFVTGKCWQGHIMKFAWLTPSTPGGSSSDQSGRENSPSNSKATSLDANVNPEEEKLAPSSSKENVEEPEDEEKRSSDKDVEESLLNRSASSGSEETMSKDGDTC